MKTLNELKEVLLDSVLKRNISNMRDEKIGKGKVIVETTNYLLAALFSSLIMFFTLMPLKPTLLMLFLIFSSSVLFLKKGVDFILNRKLKKAIKSEDLNFFKTILNKNKYPPLRTLKYECCSDDDMSDPLREYLLKLPLDKKEMALLFTNLETIIGKSAADYCEGHEDLVKIVSEDGNISVRYLLEIIRLGENHERYKLKEKTKTEVKKIIQNIKKENVGNESESVYLNEEEMA